MKDETVYVTGESRTSVENAITKTYGAFYVAFEINGRTGGDCGGGLFRNPGADQKLRKAHVCGEENIGGRSENRGGNQEKILRIPQ